MIGRAIIRLLFLAVSAFVPMLRQGGAPQSAPTGFILRAGLLYPGDGAPIRDAHIVVRDGKIEYIRAGAKELPGDLPVVDRSDAIVTPGFIAADSTLSDAFEERAGVIASGTIIPFRTNDPSRRALDGFSFLDRRDALLASGVTTAWLAPGHRRLVNGRGAIVKLGGGAAVERTVRETAELSLTIGDSSENPPAFLEQQVPPSAENPFIPPQDQMPRTRGGAAFAILDLFEQSIAHAKNYRSAAQPDARPPFDPEALEFAELIQTKPRVRIRTNTDADVRVALQLMKEYGLRGAIVGAYEANIEAARLKESDIAAIVEIPASSNLPNVNATEPPPVRPAGVAAALVKSGVRTAITASPETPLTAWMMVLSHAARAGMSAAEIVRATTAEPARILGIDERVGILTNGRDADFVILNGQPGEPTTSVRETWIRGKVVFDRLNVERLRNEVRATPVDEGGSIVVRAGLVIPVSGEPIPNGSVAIHRGRIVAVGRDVAVPPGARVIDAGPEAVITPGLIDARSFAGLEGDSTPLSGAVNLQFLANPGSDEFRAVARGGVTTALVQGPSPALPGAPIAALKTGGPSSRALIREVVGIVIPTQGYNLDGYRNLLKRGKDYTDRWDKYFSEADKYRSDAKKAAVEEKKTDEKPEAKKDEPKTGGDEPKAADDPVTGTWEGDLSGGPIPRKEAITIKLRLKGETVSGSFSSRSPLLRGQETEFEGGKFKDSIITFTLTRAELPFPLNVELKIDRPDHMTGKVDARVVQLDIEATRTEKVAPTISVKSKGKKKGGPEMPAVDESIEPYRRLFKGDAVMVVRADARVDVEGAMAAIVDEFKIPMVVLGGSDTHELGAQMASRGVGLLTGPSLVMSRSESGLPLVTEMAMAGVPVAMGSESGTGAANFADFGFSAVARGVGADQVLRAVTLDTARLFKIDSRVGSLTAGRDGDIVIWSGPPFRGASEVRTVIVAGEIVFNNSAPADGK